MHRPRLSIDEDFLQIVDEALAVLERLSRRLLAFGRVVLKDDLQSFVQITRNLEPLANDRGVEFSLGKNRGVGSEKHSRARSTCRTDLLDAALWMPLLVFLLPRRAVAFDGRNQLA